MTARRYPIGAEVMQDGTHFRVWAPKCARVEVALEAPDRGKRFVELAVEEGGYFAGSIAGVRAGSRYRFRRDGSEPLVPDPASRYQPEGPHGPSQVVDPDFSWTDAVWEGIARANRVVYEMHIGTFTTEGTWAAAQRELPALAEMGINILEVMPVADFPGRFGWGYDGVNFFAPTRLYGTPDDFRRFVDAAHALNMGVILDVVYNHFGPDGNYLSILSDDYFSDRYKNEWGEPLNFDGPNAGPVREFFVANARYWIDEFHIDGLRLDATQQIFDISTPHILAEIGRAVRSVDPRRRTYIVAENEEQETRLVRPLDQGGYGLDALWNDDLHHSAVVALTGRNEAYYTDYLGKPQEFVSAAKWGYLYQGQYYSWQKQRRGTPALDLAPHHFVNFIENHDQIANSATGERLRARASPGRYRAMTAYLLLGPGTPMLFQGQEFGALRPFYFFADHHAELAEKVNEGRRKFLTQFASMNESDLLGQIPRPDAPDTFERCKLDAKERRRYPEIVALHKDLLHLRREDPAFRAPRHGGVDGAVLGASVFVLRFFVAGGHDRLLLVNLGAELKLRESPEPLLAPPADTLWRPLWSSEAPAYGGSGHPKLENDRDNWHIPGEAAIVLAPSEGG